jgi:hypothetical protein
VVKGFFLVAASSRIGVPLPDTLAPFRVLTAPKQINTIAKHTRLCPRGGASFVRCTVLSITFRDEIAERTQRLLEQNSFAVVVASDFKELKELCSSGNFDVALVESEIQPKVKKAIGRMLHADCPHAPVVEMCEGEPEIAGAIPVSPEQINDIIPAIRRLVDRENLKGA